jgi:hypothetical protein
MTLRVAVPLFCLLVWAVVLACTDPIIPTDPAETRASGITVQP